MRQVNSRVVKKDASLFLLVVIVLMFAAGIFAVVYTLRSDPVEDALSDDRVINVLYVIEKDSRPLCSYVLMYYPATKRAAIFDIPGEMGLLIRRINRVDRIDSVYQPRNISDFENEIERLLGIDVTFSIVITMENLNRAVDLIEGVELFIPSPVELRDGNVSVLFSSGITRLDGEKSAAYISYKNPNEDNEMAVFRRQRFFLGFLKRQGEMNTILKDPALSRLYEACLDTTMNRRMRIRLFDEFTGIDTDRINIQSVGGNLREVSGQMLLLPYYDGNLAKEIVRQTMGGLTRPNEGLLSDRVNTVEVLNGTAVNGLAGRTAELLRGFGYDVITIGNADHSSHDRTQIINRLGREDMVKTFADIIRCRNIFSEAPVQEVIEGDIGMQHFEFQADFTLIIGRDFNGRYVTGD
ncbi:MAG: LCP family protein [Treponema sp.]|nr:LCP family protein [Treponema sp.]